MKSILAISAIASVLLASGAAWAKDGGGHDDDDGIVYLAKPLDTTAANPATGNAWFGSGNTILNYMKTISRRGELELGLKVHYRTGFDILPAFVRDEEDIGTEVPTGAQIIDPARGVSSARADRAAWSIDFSVNSGVGPAVDTLANYDVTLTFDLDPSERTRPLRLTMFRAPGTPAAGVSGYQWKADNGVVVIGDDAGTDRVTQNSFNYAFIAALIDTSPAPGIQPYTFGPGKFVIELSARSRLTWERTTLTYSVDVK